MAKPVEKAASFTEILAAELKEITKRKQMLGARRRAAAAEAEPAEPTPSGKSQQPSRASADAPAEYPSRWEQTSPEAASRTELRPKDPDPCEDVRHDGETPIQSANRANLAGLAFSGGGIRSATVNLGVLQGLAKRKLLHKFDYLSTISGGGYIGAWLAGWIRRRKMAEVEERLGANRATLPNFREPLEIRFLREYSNYLTPRKGLLGTDTWTGIAIYFRNLILNQLVLILFIASVLLAPRVLAAVPVIHNTWFVANSYWYLILLVLCIPALWCISQNMEYYTVDPVDRVVARLTENLVDSLEVQAELIISDPKFRPDLGKPKLPIEIWDSTITRRRAIQSGTHLSGFDTTERKTKVKFTKKVTACEGDLIIAVYPKLATGPWISWLLTLPTLLGAAFLSCILARTDPKDCASGCDTLAADLFASPWTWAAAGALVLCVLWLFAFFIFHRNIDTPEQGPFRRRVTLVAAYLSPFVAGGAGGLLLWKFAGVLRAWSGDTPGMWKVLGFGTPIIALIFLAFTVLQIGILGIAFADPRREWWGRFAATLLIICFMWAAAFSLAGYAPLLLLRLFDFPKSAWLTGLGWAATTGLGILGGKSSSTGGFDSKPWKEYLLSVTPYVFIVGLLMLVSLGIHASLLRASGDSIAQYTTKSVAFHFSGAGESSPSGSETKNFNMKFDQESVKKVSDDQYWNGFAETLSPLWVVGAFAGCLLASFLLGLRVDLNEFSMHYLYRNRLVRCYLGASHRERVPNPFTGFDSHDDIPLADLTAERGYDGPIPIFGAALNLVHGQDLAWQERKAESFVMTPKFCGFDVWFEQLPRPGQGEKADLEQFGYRPTDEFAYQNGLFLGTAMAISGAAASPNMGYLSSPALGFLMTVFNVRLGWWVGNPRHSHSWKNAGPFIGLAYLLVELFGFTDDSRKYVYLSDGGHFDNLGIYELVKRRCRLILACDADADKNLTCDNLASVIRMCRSDMGIEITLRTDKIVATGTPPYSKWHCAIGEIQYKLSDPHAENGILIYLKSSLTSDEPTDVLNYKSRCPDFPHQSTAEQWFTESQFESYRALGRHIIESLLDGIDANGFVNLKPWI